MRSKSLRELQHGGKKQVGSEPVLLTNRQGPVGVLIPVTAETLPMIQSQVDRWAALQGLRETWKQARAAKLDEMTDQAIAEEVASTRQALRSRTKRGK